MYAQEIFAWRFVELCLCLVVSETSSYFTRTPYLLRTSLTTFFFTPIAVYTRHFSCVPSTNQDWPNFVEFCYSLDAEQSGCTAVTNENRTINEMSATVLLGWTLYWNTEQRLADGQAVVELLHVVHTEVVTYVLRCKIGIW